MCIKVNLIWQWVSQKLHKCLQSWPNYLAQIPCDQYHWVKLWSFFNYSNVCSSEQLNYLELTIWNNSTNRSFVQCWINEHNLSMIIQSVFELDTQFPLLVQDGCILWPMQVTEHIHCSFVENGFLGRVEIESFIPKEPPDVIRYIW